MNKINPKQLIEKNPVFESLFAPLYFKASETRRDNPIVADTESVEILEALDYDFSYFNKNKSGQFLIPVRTKILDISNRSALQASSWLDQPVASLIRTNKVFADQEE